MELAGGAGSSLRVWEASVAGGDPAGLVVKKLYIDIVLDKIPLRIKIAFFSLLFKTGTGKDLLIHVAMRRLLLVVLHISFVCEITVIHL
jgi:hypothetical protein